jgi:hypothetical protein
VLTCKSLLGLDRLIGLREKNKAQQTKEKEGPSALPKFIFKIIPHQVAERFLMAFINQVNQLRNCSLVWVVHQSLHAVTFTLTSSMAQHAGQPCLPQHSGIMLLLHMQSAANH